MSDLPEVKQVGLERSLESYFEPFEKQALEWKQKAELIVVTDASQTHLIKAAAEGLKFMKQIDKDIDATHKDLKEDALRKGQLLDSIKRKLKALTEPIKAHLQENADFVEIQEQKRKAALREERSDLLRPYMGDQVDLMQLGEMDETTFDAVLLGQKTAKEQREAKEKEDYRLWQEREEAERQEKAQRAIWLARVNLITPFGLVWDAKAEAYVKDDFNVSLVEIKNDSDEKFAEKCLAISNEISKRREKELREQKKQQEKLAAEQARRRQAEEKLKQQEEEQAAKIAAEKKLKRAPDKTKLKSLADQIKLLPLPELKEEESKMILRNVQVLLSKAVKYIEEQTESL